MQLGSPPATAWHILARKCCWRGWFQFASAEGHGKNLLFETLVGEKILGMALIFAHSAELNSDINIDIWVYNSIDLGSGTGLNVRSIQVWLAKPCILCIIGCSQFMFYRSIDWPCPATLHIWWSAEGAGHAAHKNPCYLSSLGERFFRDYSVLLLLLWGNTSIVGIVRKDLVTSPRRVYSLCVQSGCIAACIHKSYPASKISADEFHLSHRQFADSSF